jgi:ribonuclease E
VPVPVAAKSAPSVSTVPAPAVVASVLPEQPSVGPTVVRTVISTPPSPVVASPVESIAPAVVAVAAVAPTVPALLINVSNDAPSAVAPTRTLEQSVPASQPTRSEADVARTQQAVAKFAAAQDALRNFRLQMPAMQAPATVAASEARVVAASAPTPDSPAVQPTAIRQRNIPPAATASAPVPLVSFPGKSPGDAAGLTELDTLSRAAEAMKRLSKKLGSPRIR